MDFTEEDKEKLDKLHTDMYYGKDRDNPSVTTRLDRTERSQEQLTSILTRLAWTTVGTVCAVIGEVVLRLLHKL